MNGLWVEYSVDFSRGYSDLKLERTSFFTFRSDDSELLNARGEVFKLAGVGIPDRLGVKGVTDLLMRRGGNLDRLGVG